MKSPELACVVLALGNPPGLVEAVRSLIEQSLQSEVVVVNSGGGGAWSTLRAAGLELPVVERQEPLLPGAARNLGIASSRAPFVSFLAADCWAEPGWVEARMRAHGAGARAVASAVTNPYRRSLAAWTSYLTLFHRRMPGLPAEMALPYGASYDRELLAGCGGFRADLRGGEDTELHQRLAGWVEILWEPRVRTAHRHPRTARALLRDQLQRGSRSARSWALLGGPRASAVALDSLTRVRATLRTGWRYAAREDRKWVAAAIPFVPLAALAYAAGALTATGPPPAEGIQQESCSQRQP